MNDFLIWQVNFLFKTLTLGLDLQFHQETGWRWPCGRSSECLPSLRCKASSLQTNIWHLWLQKYSKVPLFFLIYQAYFDPYNVYISGSSHHKCNSYSITLIITYKRWTHWFIIGLLPTRIANEHILDNPPFWHLECPKFTRLNIYSMWPKTSDWAFKLTKKVFTEVPANDHCPTDAYIWKA